MTALDGFETMCRVAIFSKETELAASVYMAANLQTRILSPSTLEQDSFQW